jgi:DNA-binding Lrp family transcriptional regulator
MSSKAFRNQAIRTYIITNRATTKEISEALGIPYPTVTRLIKELVDDGKAEIIYYRHGEGGNVYQAAHVDEMPSIKVGNGLNDRMKMIDVVKNFVTGSIINDKHVREFHAPLIEQGIADVARVAVTLLYQAVEAEEHEKFPSDKERNDLHKRLIQTKRRLQTMIDLIHQFETANIWTNDALKGVATSETYDAAVIAQMFSALTTYQERDNA